MALEFNEKILRDINLSAATDKTRQKLCRIYLSVRDEALSDLRLEDLAKLLYLYSFTDDTRSVFSLEKGDYLTKSECLDLLGGSRRNAARWLKTLSEAGRLTFTENPSQVFIKEIDSEVFENPKKQQVYMLARWLLKWIYVMPEQKYTNYCSNPVWRLGAMLRLMPFINWRYNILCENPRETRLDKIEVLGEYRIAKILGCESDASNTCGKLCEIMSLPDGYFSPIRWCTTEYGKDCYLVNPEFCRTECMHWSIYSTTLYHGSRTIFDADYIQDKEDSRRYGEEWDETRPQFSYDDFGEH